MDSAWADLAAAAVLLLPPEGPAWAGGPLGAGLLLIAASFLGSLLTAALGIGGGGFLLGVMALLVPPAALIPVHGVVQVGSNAGRAALFLSHVYWPAFGGFALGTIIGVAAGGLLAVQLPAALVQIGVGGFVLWTVLAKPPRWLSAWPAIAGGVSSFLTMFFGATGLFVASYTRSLALARHNHVATHAALMTLQHGLKVVAFGLLGFAFSAWGGLILSMLLAGGAGTYIGKLLLNRLNESLFRRGLETLLVLISLQLIWSGFLDL